mmetsp:Transcript_38550/g.97811  ORF Transcript_38550/g.97811 Transcript_38550/m.97811 type:complete len:211 (-) Transcript_38550:163-795(-)
MWTSAVIIGALELAPADGATGVEVANTATVGSRPDAESLARLLRSARSISRRVLPSRSSSLSLSPKTPATFRLCALPPAFFSVAARPPGAGAEDEDAVRGGESPRRSSATAQEPTVDDASAREKGCRLSPPPPPPAASASAAPISLKASARPRSATGRPSVSRYVQARRLGAPSGACNAAGPSSVPQCSGRRTSTGRSCRGTRASCATSL